MPKQRTAFNISLTTDGEVKVTALADKVRKALSGQEIYTGVDGKRKAVKVVKVAVSHVGER